MSVGNKIDFLFRFVPFDIRRQLLFDEEASYSVTDQCTADKITKDLLETLGGDAHARVCDATACIGGNAYSFSRTFKRITAIEYHPQRYDYLKHNMKTLGCKNVDCVWGDCTIVCIDKGRIWDLIFLDPPWGGPGYKSGSASLSLGGIPIQTICQQFSSHAKWLAIKTPIHFDIESFSRETSAFMTHHHTKKDLRKMHVSVFKSKLS